MRKLLLGILIIVVLMLLVLGGGMLWLRSASPTTAGTVQVRGLNAPVEIRRDSLGVPHIWAGSTRDLLFAQGFAHAQDRLWQLELLRRGAEGRLAEVFGPDYVDTDRFLRGIGIWWAAGRAERELEPRVRRWLEAYAAGVNAGVASRSGALPPEFILLRTEPGIWTVRHTLAVEKLMAWDLALYGTSRNMARAAERLGEERARRLLPGEQSSRATILVGAAPPRVPAPAALLLEAASIARASNSWVIGGEHTRSGAPILANDTHLRLQAPSLWYLVGLHADASPPAASTDGAPAIDAVGMSLPGAPLVVLGRNRAVAWGFTNAMVDDLDFFLERTDPADSTRYLTPAGSEPFIVVTDTIHAKGAERPVVFRQRFTRHGPVLSDVDDGFGERVISFRWVAHDPSPTFQALHAMNVADGADALVRALDGFENPHQNVVYADTAGRYGFVMAGRVPTRANGEPPPLLPVPGWTGEWDWTGQLPYAEHPRLESPPRGFVVTANNRQTAGPDAETITRFWAPPFRALRITRLLEERIARGELFNADIVHRMQLDVGDEHAARYRDRAVEAAEGAGLANAAQVLADWDLRASADSRGAALYYPWLHSLGAAAAEDLYGSGGGWFPDAALNELLERRRPFWVEEDAGAAYDAMARDAMRSADSIAAGMRWGELQSVRVEHAFGGRKWLDRVFGFDIGGDPRPGTGSTVNASAASGGFPRVVAYGPSQRHVVDLGETSERQGAPDSESVPIAGGFILPSGQSGVPFSSHYRDQYPLWRDGGLWALPLERSAVNARSPHILRLEPAR